jgi:hypothetical protein
MTQHCFINKRYGGPWDQSTLDAYVVYGIYCKILEGEGEVVRYGLGTRSDAQFERNSQKLLPIFKSNAIPPGLDMTTFDVWMKENIADFRYAF